MRKGRKFELLVKEIKELLMEGAKIKSPEIVKDIDTNTNREIDIGIRLDVKDNTGSRNEVFIAIECRDRGSTQDITWIEQLITKKESICADTLIAVTSSRFTKNAITKALKKGILIRNVKSFKAKELLELRDETFVEIEEFIDCGFMELKFFHENSQHVCKLSSNTKIHHEKSNKSMTIEEYYGHQIEKGIFLKISDKFSKSGETKAFKLTDEERLSLVHENGSRDAIIKTDIVIKATKSIERLPIASLKEYIDSSNSELKAEYSVFKTKEIGTNVKLINDIKNANSSISFDLSTRNKDRSILLSILLKCKNATSIARYSFKG